jgi:acyl-coenzyme A synthetase/AMP-(fatty) acid ligase
MTAPGLPLTLPGLLAARRPDSPALRAVVGDDGTLTFAELHRAPRDLAARLVAAVVGMGERVGLLPPTSARWVVVARAVARTGGALIPLSTLLRPPELLDQRRTALVSHLLAGPWFRGRDQRADLSEVVPEVMAAFRVGERAASLPALRRTCRLARTAVAGSRSRGSRSGSPTRTAAPSGRPARRGRSACAGRR